MTKQTENNMALDILLPLSEALKDIEIVFMAYTPEAGGSYITMSAIWNGGYLCKDQVYVPAEYKTMNQFDIKDIHGKRRLIAVRG